MVYWDKNKTMCIKIFYFFLNQCKDLKAQRLQYGFEELLVQLQIPIYMAFICF
jgi:hypothetical protein